MKGKFVIYQMLPRVFGNTRGTSVPGGSLAGNGTGKFKDITLSVLGEIRKLNVTHVWYTGVIRHATAVIRVSRAEPVPRLPSRTTTMSIHISRPVKATG